MSYFDSIISRDDFVMTVRKVFWNYQVGNSLKLSDFIDILSNRVKSVDDGYSLSYFVSPSIDGDFEVVFHFKNIDKVKSFDIVGYFLTECYSSGDSHFKSYKLYDHCPCYYSKNK